MRIEIVSQEPSAMRYPTVGDWQWLPDGSLRVDVASYGGNTAGELLVALHEVVEAFLCQRNGVTQEQVDQFDISHPELEEPGDNRDAPYHKEHLIATRVEKSAAFALVDWDDHESWVKRTADEVDRALQNSASQITVQGPRFWAELHSFALRHEGKNRAIHGWFLDWMGDLPFYGCPCKEHLEQYVSENTPDYQNFFEWTIDLHNAVNERIGKRTINYDDARTLWLKKTF